MATETYIPLAAITLAAGGSALFFTEISQDYSDLVLVCENSTGGSNGNFQCRFNGDSGSNYHTVSIQGTGSSASTGDYQSAEFSGQSTSSGRALNSIQIIDYSATDKHKAFLFRGNSSYSSRADVGRWADTTAITSISITTNQTWDIGSTFKLFGIHGEVV
tara:strand:- start:647 stop:1129 length:483 start_codon:yes stop_codon:yes gene_type:complete